MNMKPKLKWDNPKNPIGNGTIYNVKAYVTRYSISRKPFNNKILVPYFSGTIIDGTHFSPKASADSLPLTLGGELFGWDDWYFEKQQALDRVEYMRQCKLLYLKEQLNYFTGLEIGVATK